MVLIPDVMVTTFELSHNILVLFQFLSLGQDFMLCKSVPVFDYCRWLTEEFDNFQWSVMQSIDRLFEDAAVIAIQRYH